MYYDYFYRMKFKNISYDIKDFDEKQGIVVAYANVYGVKDSDGDISAKGSFLKTVPENFNRIGVFKNHDPNRPVGIPLEIDPRDSYGLLTKTKFDLSITDGKEMYNHIKFKQENNRNTELSIGYEVIKRDQKSRSIITEYKLWEYSFLTAWGANSLSLVEDVKNMKSVDEAFIYLSKAYDFDFNDTTKIELEQILKSLDNKEPLATNTFKEEPTADQIKQTLIETFKKWK